MSNEDGWATIDTTVFDPGDPKGRMETTNAFAGMQSMFDEAGLAAVGTTGRR